MRRLLPALALLLSWLACAGAGPAIRVAVAANFLPVMRELAQLWEQQGRTPPLRLSSASTGALATQILHGSPFDLFLSADTLRVQMLQREGVGLERRLYAEGRLALWVLESDAASAAWLGEPRRIAIAEPRSAPYGRAAQQGLVALGCWELQEPGIVHGENIAQTFQLAAAGGLEGALIAYSQAERALDSGGSIWLLPDSLHAPILQEALLLSDSPEARACWTWLFEDPEVQRLIRGSGYRLANGKR